MGRRNARVLPDPVEAMAIREEPERMGGMVVS